MTEKQERYISWLLDEQGFKNSKFKKAYMAALIKSVREYQKVSDLIDELLEEKAKNNSKEYIYESRDYINASDLSAYTFCPASFSIKNTYEIPPTLDMEKGEEQHDEFYLEKFLNNLHSRRYAGNEMIDFLDKYLDGNPTENDPKRYVKKDGDNFDDMLRSSIVYRGHEDDSEPFISNKGNLVSKPDYIFKLPEGDSFLVEEKHSWRNTLAHPWKSDVIQLLAYMYSIEEINSNKSHLIYFFWHFHYGELRTKNPRIFTIRKNQSNKKIISSVFLAVNKFIKLGQIDFDIDGLRASRCAGCSSRVFCNHKTGKLNKVSYPYK